MAAAVPVGAVAADASKLAPDVPPEGMERLLHSLVRGNCDFLSRIDGTGGRIQTWARSVTPMGVSFYRQEDEICQGDTTTA